MGIWVPCEFSDWCAQLVIAEKSRICHFARIMDKYKVMAG